MNDCPILSTGAWTDPDERHHRFDAALCRALVEWFAEIDGTAVDLGCGPGRYLAALLEGCPRLRIVGYDGNPNLAFIPGASTAHHADLTTCDHLCVSIDWLICLEVAEHIPPKYEQKLFDHFANIETGIILSWAVPGQSGFGHCNCQPAHYVFQKMRQLGFTEALALFFRRRATIEYFRNNLRFFVRPQHLEVFERLRRLA